MPIQNVIWTVSEKPEQLPPGKLLSEHFLEDMIVASPGILSDEWLLIGRQEQTGLGGIVDLLAITPDGGIVIIELKRDKTPRVVVAQAIDYAAWVETLTASDILKIYSRYAPSRSLNADFFARFGTNLDEEKINENHQIAIVASTLDDSSERIVTYLNKRGISINVLCFQIFQSLENQLLSRTWLLDPVHVQASAVETPKRAREDWNGEFYASLVRVIRVHGPKPENSASSVQVGEHGTATH